MIRSLRRAQRWIATGLAIALPLAYASILLRRPAAVPPPLTAGLDLPIVAATPGLHARLDPRADGGWTVALAMPEAAPDLLAYWSMEKPTSPSGDAVLLGPLPPQARSYALPGKDAAGYLLIYSVAYRATQAVIPVASLERSR